jgi:hypothetical protein
VKVIDANTGIELSEGISFDNINGRIDVFKIQPGVFSARALVRRDGGEPVWVPLTVRWTHPGFFFQHVAFLPSYGVRPFDVDAVGVPQPDGSQVVCHRGGSW